MRIAHISDLHVLALQGAVPFRLFNKRATGYANLRFHRKSIHKSEIVEAIIRHLANARVDHVVISGDVSNLALEAEFAAVRAMLDDTLGLSPDHVSIVPGNHDVYTRGAQKRRRFSNYFAPYLSSDLPSLSTDHAGGMFPVVKLRGPVAIIGLSTAMARPPFFASGRLGTDQLDALAQILASAEVKARTPIFVLHHPVHNPSTWMKRQMEGLDDAARLRALLAPLPRGLLLHGHLHRRILRRIDTRQGHIDAVGATSASLVHESPARMAGYNTYEIGDDGTILSLEGYAFDPASHEFTKVGLPRVEH